MVLGDLEYISDELLQAKVCLHNGFGSGVLGNTRPAFSGKQEEGVDGCAIAVH